MHVNDLTREKALELNVGDILSGPAILGSITGEEGSEWRVTAKHKAKSGHPTILFNISVMGVTLEGRRLRVGLQGMEWA